MKAKVLVCGLLAVAAIALSPVWADPSVVGSVVGEKPFLVDKFVQRGTGTVFEGSLVETREGRTLLRLQGGMVAELGPGSRTRVFRDRLVLETGRSKVSGRGSLVEANGLLVSHTGELEVQLVGKTLNVTAKEGAAEVKTRDGVLLARLLRGETLGFEPQAATASAPFEVEGCLVKQGDAVVLTDTVSKVKFQIQGEEVSLHVGRQVRIIGAALLGAKPTAADASQVLRVNLLKVVSMGCPVAGDRQEEARGPGRSEGAGLKGGKSKAIIAGVAIGAGVAAATVGLTGQEEKPTTISR